MKAEPKKPVAAKDKSKIETDLPLSEKDEVKRAEENMRKAQSKAKK